MYKHSKTIIPYEHIDTEVVNLCKALNSIEGVETEESCSGHGKEPCQIWFKVRNVTTFNKLMFHCFNGSSMWQIKVNLADPHRDWVELHLVLTSTSVLKNDDFENLAKRICSKIEDMKMTAYEWEFLRSE